MIPDAVTSSSQDDDLSSINVLSDTILIDPFLEEKSVNVDIN